MNNNNLKKANKYKCIKRLFAAALIFSLVLGFIPVDASAASKIYRTETVYDPIEVAAVMYKKATVYKADLETIKTISGANVSIKKGTSVTVIGEKTSEAGKKFYRVSFVHTNKKTYTGYVKYTTVNLTPEKAATAQVFNVETTKAIRAKAESSTALKSGSTKVTVKNKTAVKIVKEYYVGTTKWYYVSFTFNSKTVKGYIHPKYVKLTKTKRTVKIYALTEKEFEEALTKQGFPEDYKPYLRALHEKYPFWEFQAYNTGIKWATALKNESKVGRNLISNSKSAAWKSTDPAAYDETTGKWKVFDGSTWVAASQEAIAYYMDPRNSLDDTTIYQFELLGYQVEYQTATGINQVLKNTPFSGKSFTYVNPSTGKEAKISYTNAYIAAAKESGVSPLHLASRTKQEVVTSATTTSGAVTGTNKTYPGIYNFYNIGATSGTNAMLNGLKWASTGTTYMRPWSDPYRSIVGGATYIGESYISKGQNTIYLENFDVTPYSTYTHQYMTNVEAANSEAIKVQKGYADAGLLDKTPLVFSIPVYLNMPTTVCAAPK